MTYLSAEQATSLSRAFITKDAKEEQITAIMRSIQAAAIIGKQRAYAEHRETGKRGLVREIIVAKTASDLSNGRDEPRRSEA